MVFVGLLSFVSLCVFVCLFLSVIYMLYIHIYIADDNSITDAIHVQFHSNPLVSVFHALPVVPGQDGHRSFILSHTGKIGQDKIRQG